MMRRPAMAKPAASNHNRKRLLHKQPSMVRIRRRYCSKRPARPEEAEQPANKHSRTEVFPCLPKANVCIPLRKIVYFLRGPPGCGKSTAARSLLSQHLRSQFVQWQPDAKGAAFSPVSRAFILSTDDYFTEVDNAGHAKYSFNPKLLRERHKRNQLRCEVLMELDVTPLFIDNTNIALWEMRTYIQLADRFDYTVEVIDPRDLSLGALDPSILHARLERDQGNRAHGKAINMGTLERMATNFEDLPRDEPLQAIRDALAPWERKEKLPLYAGLDTEARTLAALGAIELGQSFWGEVDHGDMPPRKHILDARYWEDPPWMLPDRLHVTVRFFGGSAQREDLCEAEKLIGTWHDVIATALVFVRGGGILCAAVDLGKDAECLREVAGPDWWPHVTLLTSPPWRPVDSTLLLQAWDAAEEAARASPSIPPPPLPAAAMEAFGVKIFPGFTEQTCRIVFGYGETFAPNAPKLLTILPSGVVENSKMLEPRAQKGLAAFAYPQSMDVEIARGFCETPFVWKREDGTHCLIQSWPITINDKFRSDFEISVGTNPDPARFHPQAAVEFKESMSKLFGETVSDDQIMFCHKCTVSDSPVLVGKSEDIMRGLREYPQLMHELAIARIETDLCFVAAGTTGNGESFEKEFHLAPGVESVVYRKDGWETMGCSKPYEQFEREAELHTVTQGGMSTDTVYPDREAGANIEVQTGHLSMEPSIEQHVSKPDVTADKLPASEPPHPAVSTSEHDLSEGVLGQKPAGPAKQDITEVMEQKILDPHGITDQRTTPVPMSGGEAKIYTDVVIKGKTVDLCVVPLCPPCIIGPCQFRFFQ
mmetsp:Transcript_81147/g.160868  ORF Transcript_81147/g.160868 Transcript_81147/m.160868 type:complete len:822 (+) Transcript_81147:61-2526(+)